MNVELRGYEESKYSNELKNARLKRQMGDSEIQTGCLICKFKPNCEDAIPFYVEAAEAFHGAKLLKDELYCREKLAYCYRVLNSEWEEGNEHEKIAYIYLNGLDNQEAAWKAIQNAYNSYFKKAEYKDAVNSVKKLGELYKARDSLDHAEKCLKIAYEAFLQTFHTFATKNDEPYEFLYVALDVYLAILVKMMKFKTAIETCDNAIKASEQFEENTDKLLHIYGFALFTCIVSDDNSTFKSIVESAKNKCKNYSDTKWINNIEKLDEAIQGVNEHQFIDCMIEIDTVYPIEITKKLNEAFILKKEKIIRKSSSENEVIVVIADDEKEPESNNYL